MKKRLLLLTGSPGVGKTTVLLRIVEGLKSRGYNVGGTMSRESRSEKGRVGFEILDLESGKIGWLAHVNQKSGPQVGKYRVNLQDLDNIGAEAILGAVKESDLIAIDEIGPMELFSEKFKAAVKQAVESRKLVVSVVHWRARNQLLEEIKAREDAETYLITYENRERLHKTVVEKALDFLSETTRE